MTAEERKNTGAVPTAHSWLGQVSGRGLLLDLHVGECL